MLIIKVRQKGGIERALKEYKSKIVKTKQIKKLREAKEFEKPSQKKRKRHAKARYLQSKYNSL